MPLSIMIKRFFSVMFVFFIAIAAATHMSGCSAGQKGLLTITPEQYFYSAKEKLETIDERNYEIRDLDEIIRVLENAEKDAKKAEIIDRSRLYLCLANVLKAEKLYQNSLMKGEYIANRAEPFFVVNTKDVKETLRIARKWMRACEAQFKTRTLLPDLNYVKGMFHAIKLITQHSREKKESLNEAVASFRRCTGLAPDYKSDFRLFGRFQTPREVRFRLIKTLAIAEQQADAYGLLSEFNFSAISPVSGATDYQDFAWHHAQGFTLAMMGKYDEAIAILEKFKIVAPQDYPQVDEALWILEGIYDHLAELRKDEKYQMEARIVAALQKKLKGPFSKEQYSTAAHLFPRLLAGDLQFFDAVTRFYSGNFKEAAAVLQPIINRGLMNSSNKLHTRLLSIECSLYSGEKISDDLLEDLIQLAGNANLTPLQKERAGHLLARYVMDQDQKFDISKVNHDGQTFIRHITGKPWALSCIHKRGELKRATKPVTHRTGEDSEDNSSKREPGSLIAEIYANKPEDWVVSANLYLISLPDMNLLGTGRIVGRENEGEGWVFKDAQIDQMRRNKNYLAVFEYDNSDSEKSIQGLIFNP
jgi:tetratricopeptide (TPR) repeat protein